MGESGFVECENVFSIKCKGEVVNLLHVAERYGVLMEKAGARIEAICRQCRDFSRLGSSGKDQRAALANRNGQREPEGADLRAIA